jgi:RsiW-degrading membrane proteinase PrsW (M82 family)
MGFATVENLMYIFGQETFEEALRVGQMRAWTAVPAHATFAALMGFFAGRARFGRGGAAYLLVGLLLAILFHGAYDFFLMQQWSPQLTGGAIVSLVVGVGLSLRAIRLHQRHRPS